MTTTITLSQTLAGDWVVTIPNPEEAGCETELAMFHASATAPDTLARFVMLDTAAQTAGRFAFNLGKGQLEVRSHDSRAKADMTARVLRQNDNVSIRKDDRPRIKLTRDWVWSGQTV